MPYLLFFVIPTYTYTINITATNVVGDSVISDEGMFMGAMESEMPYNSVCVRVLYMHMYMYIDREHIYYWKCVGTHIVYSGTSKQRTLWERVFCPLFGGCPYLGGSIV